MAQLHDMAAARARQAARDELKAAEVALADAEAQLDESCGIGLNLALHSRLRTAEIRIEAARTALRQIDPTFTE